MIKTTTTVFGGEECSRIKLLRRRNYMQANPSPNKTGLTLRTDVGADQAANRARLSLLQIVFDFEPSETSLAPRWTAFGYFDEHGDCVASLEIARLDLMLDHEIRCARGIRHVAVHPRWRGLGLSRDLMTAALGTTPGLVLLYAETSDLYVRYGFRSMPQHAFVGKAPFPVGGRTMFALDPMNDRGLIERMLSSRAPVSTSCALVGAPGLFFDRLAADPDIRLAHLPETETIVAYEVADETLVLVDVVANHMPSLAAMLGALGIGVATVKTLFPPDKLGWRGDPVRDDTGLMLRGTVPPAMTVPFMLPPTAEF